jgi:hypothetical protein
MHFCLATPNRQAPGPQYWRYFLSESRGDCKTDVLTMTARAEDQWKLRPDDKILFGESMEPEDGQEERSRLMSVEEKIRIGEMGDDLAEEANLSIAI